MEAGARKIRAIWLPHWYGDDQSLEVGKEGEHEFYKCVPDYLKEFGDVLFSSMNILGIQTRPLSSK
jgi:hypothetical protein